MAAVLTLPAGSLVATFSSPIGGSHGGCAGPPSDPVHYGQVLWIQEGNRVYELDMGNGPGNAVAPASLGKVKALFR